MTADLSRLTAEQFAQTVRADIQAWRPTIEAAQVRLDEAAPLPKK